MKPAHQIQIAEEDFKFSQRLDSGEKAEPEMLWWYPTFHYRSA
jgi:hypothetical protein